MEPLITASELDALMQAANAAEPEKPVRPLNLVAREHCAFAVLPELQAAADRLADRLARYCSKQFGLAAQGSADPVEVLPGSQVMDFLGAPRFVYGMKAPGDVEAGLLAIDGALGGAYVMRQFGGAIEEGSYADAPPTPTERRTVQRLAVSVVEALQAALDPVATLRAAVDSQWRPLNQGVAAVTMVVRLAMGEVRTSVTTAVVTSAAGFRSPLQTKAPVYVPSPGPLAGPLGRVPVTVKSVLGSSELSVRRFLSLKVGDLLTLGTPVDGPIPLLVEGKPKFLGLPQLNRGQLSLQLTEHAED
ncbi:MAG: FliM/FliN family flagellar motor switch protein [Deltaproteobacteria bacterium]|nr:FliM/FliN family flagellar motor switch protein [Deltaproteobacteria bacterium]